jgi:flagellar hook protein FlgE
MLQALLAGVASIKAQQTRMNVIGNNLANVNTTAFKGSRVTFQDMISQTLRGASRPSSALGGRNPLQLGLGVLVGGTDANMEQGSLNATNRPGDLAIQGNGYFVVSDGSALTYTRDGSFDLDANGDLVMRATGQKVMGWKADASGNIDSTQPVDASSAINIPVGQQSAVQQTSQISMAGNLKGTAASTDSWTTTVRVYDSLGGSHDITVKFKNRQSPPAGTAPAGATSSWDWEASEGGTLIGDSSSTGNQRLYFDGSGALLNPTALGTITVPASGASAAFDIGIDFSTITQLSSETSVQVSSQNGYPAGSLQGFSIGNDGTVIGIFTNGLTRGLGQIALSNFPNPGGLERIGNNQFRQTDNSGIASIGTAKTAGRGNINAGFLEQSNVDIGTEFTELIVTQRGFQANTRVVTTVDEMLQDLINIKR